MLLFRSDNMFELYLTVNVDILTHLLTKGYTDHMSISCDNERINLNSFLVAAVNVVTSSLLRSSSGDLSLTCLKAKELHYLLQCFSQQGKDYVPNKNLLETLLSLVNFNTCSENNESLAVEHNQLEASNPLTPPDEHNSFENIQSESANQLEASTQIIDQSEPETNDHNYFEMLEDSEEPVIISFKKLDEENLKVLLDKTVDNTCGICKKQFKGGLSSYRIHLRKCHGVVISCHLCHRTFTSYHTQRNHLARSHKIGVPASYLKCDLCGKAMRNNQLPSHLRAHEVKEGRKILGQEEVPCEECGKLIHPASLQIHKNNHRRRIRQLNNAEIKTCEKCGKAMKAYLLPTHRCNCGKPMVKVLCNFCGKEVVETSLRNHIQKQHDPNYKPKPEPRVNCTVCGKEFSKQGLSKHMESHGPTKECDICGAIVKQLAVHKRTVHLREDQINGSCPECGKGFASLYSMKQHRMNVHLKQYPYQCRYSGCEAKYNDKGN